MWVGYLLAAVGSLGGPIAIGIAILRYRLYEIDTLINYTLVYGSLTAMFVALYFVGIVVLQRFFILLTGQQSTLAIVASILLIAALFTPLPSPRGMGDLADVSSIRVHREDGAPGQSKI